MASILPYWGGFRRISGPEGSRVTSEQYKATHSRVTVYYQPVLGLLLLRKPSRIFLKPLQGE
jgi:hypothetical protein